MNIKYRCALCGKEYETIEERAKCELADVENEKNKKAEEAKIKEEVERKKKEKIKEDKKNIIIEKHKELEKLVDEYIEEYGVLCIGYDNNDMSFFDTFTHLF